ncbi:hypothetical protein PWR66_00090 [Paraburkholderia sp. A1RO-5]|uniref:hypothetical protein n=1 Tax=Paraburkholderia sp. A1RO-5 TaxID=3028369 RepID=UPI003B827907
MPKLLHDPRTVARDVPGLFEAVFPRLTASVVAYLNKRKSSVPGILPISAELVERSSLDRAMLFELGVAAGEMLLTSGSANWEECKRVALARQRRYFDAELPDKITDVDQAIAERVGRNIATSIGQFAAERGQPAIIAPLIPGLRWVSSGHGDFSMGSSLIEVKCSNRNFSAADYRQVVLYWLLGYAAAVENRGQEWSEGILLNPRLGHYVSFKFGEILHIIGAGRTKVEALQLFASMVGDDRSR